MPVTTTHSTTAQETVARPETPAVEDVLAAIAVDSKTAPETYLRETEVPHGGE